MEIKKFQSEHSWQKAYPGPEEQKTIDLFVNHWLYDDENGWLLKRYREESNTADEEGRGDDFPSPFGWLIEAWQIELLEYDEVIYNLKPLEILTEVGHLEIAVGPDTDLTPLGSMVNLRRLRLFGSYNGDYSFLKSLPHLEELYLARGHGGTNLNSIGLLKNLKKLTFFISSDLNAIAGATSLEFLDVQRSWVRDLNPIKNLKSLEYLFIQNNLISDISVLRELPKLHRLELSQNCITDFSALDGLNMQAWVRKELRDSQQLNGTHELLKLILDNPIDLNLWVDYTRWLIQQGDPLGEKLKDKLEGKWNQLPDFWAMGEEYEKRKNRDTRTLKPIMKV